MRCSKVSKSFLILNIELIICQEENTGSWFNSVLKKMVYASKICVMPYSLADLSLRIGLLLQESIHDLCTTIAVLSLD